MHSRSRTAARAIDRMLADAGSERAIYRRARPVWNVRAIRAAEADLRGLAEDLKSGLVDEPTARAALSLVTDGAGSPLFHSDPVAAVRAVRAVRGAADAALARTGAHVHAA